MVHSRPSAAPTLAVVAAFLMASVALALTAGVADAAVKRCFGRNPTIVGTNAPDHLVGTSGNDVIAGLGGDDLIEGMGGNDYICGNAGYDLVDGGGGRDSVNGGADDDILFGAGSADLLAGGSGIDILVGETGNDTYNGGGGIDVVAFIGSAKPVIVDLRERFATGEGTDGVHYVEGVIGSDHADSLYGNAYVNVFEALLGDDLIHGRGNADVVFYTNAVAAVSVDLELGVGSGPIGTDTLLSIEDALGSAYDDTLLGTSGPNVLDGGDGEDTIDGRGGADTCFGEIVTGCDGAAGSSLAAGRGAMLVENALRALTERR